MVVLGSLHPIVKMNKENTRSNLYFINKTFSKFNIFKCLVLVGLAIA